MIIPVSGRNIHPKDIIKNNEIDKLVYPDYYWLTDEYVLTMFNKCPNAYTIVKDLDKQLVIAHVDIYPIGKDLYDKFLTGDFLDTEIVPDDLITLSKDKDAYLYFSSIVSRPEYRGFGVGSLLLKSVGEKLLELARDGIYFKGIVADVISTHGSKICLKLGLSKLKDSSHHSEIYARDLTPCDQIRMGKILMDQIYN